MNDMKTLYITNSYLKGNNGGVYCTKSRINAFISLSTSITIVYPITKALPAEDLLDGNVELIPVEDHRSKPRKFLDLCMGKVNRFQKSLFSLVNPAKFDVVVFDSSVASSGIIKRIKRMGVTTVTMHHNYQIEYLKADSSKLTLVPNLLWTYKYEKEAVRYSDINFTVTPDDMLLLRTHYGDGVFEVLRVFEYKSALKEISDETASGHRYVITGWLGSRQTEESLMPWIERYYPILQETDPLASLTIAGRNPSKKLTSLAESRGIKVIASPVDMQPILEDADFYINTTDCGGGLKQRNMDGLKNGLPVVTHIVSARGYEEFQEKGVVLAYDSPKTFAECIQRVQEINMTKREVFSIYRELFSLEAGISKLRRMLTDHGISID